MQFLDLPITLEDMTCSLSLTGMTQLTKSRYKSRHSGSKEIIQVPRKGFLLKKDDVTSQATVAVRKKRTNRPKQVPVQSKIARSSLRQYTINKKEVTHRIRNYVNQMKGEKLLYFWTVTFPLFTTDDTAHILLNKWLTRLRTERMIKEYLWITERQENKTLHFHMVINRKMDVQKANKYMRASIMHSINSGEIQYDRTKAMRYNGVDIAKDRKTRRVINFAKQNRQKALTNYLTKYVTKNNEAFTHLAWHSSREYSNLIIAVRFTHKEITASNIIDLLNQDTPIIGEYYIFYRWKGKPPNELLHYLSQLNNGLQSLIK